MVAYAPPPEILNVVSNLVRQTTGTVTLCRGVSGTTVLTRAVSLTTTVDRVHAASGSLIRRSFTVEVER